MKKLFILFGITAIILGSIWSQRAFFYGQFLTKPVTQQQLYYGVNVDMSQLLPGSRNYIVNAKGQDFIDLAQQMGIHMFRITGVGKSFTTNGDTLIYTKAQWDTVLHKMAEHNIKAVILIEANSTNPALNTDTLTNRYLTLVKQIVITPQLGSYKNVYAIDLSNEPLLTENNVQMLKKAAGIVKKAYPELPVTVGGWRLDLGYTNFSGVEQIRWNDPQDAHLLSGFVDFYAVHLYGFDQTVNGALPDPYSYTLNYFKQNAYYFNKPVLIEEFGAANGDAITDQNTLGSQALQAYIYNGFYKALTNVHTVRIIGSLAYVLYPRGLPFSDGWDLTADNGNTLYPALLVMRQYATGENTTKPIGQTQSFPQDFILQNSANGEHLPVKTGDIIALQLTLPAVKYQVTQSNTNMLTTTEPLHFDANTKSYETVMHVIKKGEVKISVLAGKTKQFWVTITAF
jgi:cellulase (glycosyl hydrolase family 5)